MERTVTWQFFHHKASSNMHKTLKHLINWKKQEKKFGKNDITAITQNYVDILYKNRVLSQVSLAQQAHIIQGCIANFFKFRVFVFFVFRTIFIWW